MPPAENLASFSLRVLLRTSTRLHRDDGKRFVGHADEKLTASMEPRMCSEVVQCFFLFVRVNRTVLAAVI